MQGLDQFLWDINVEHIRKISNNTGRILLVELKIEGVDFALINIYNSNREPVQVQIFDDLCSILIRMKDVVKCKIVSEGNFNIFFDSILDAPEGSTNI